jgi:two-component system, chemotaxis family, response regulator Rcp1
VPTAAAPIEVLLVEDNPADVRLTIEARRDATVRNRLHVAVDGVDAMDFLRRRGKHANAPSPDLILLDLNRPKQDGREVLQEITHDETVKHIPVVILTTSKAEEDIVRSYRLRPNAYVAKPADREQFLKVGRSIEEFWLEIVKRSRL